MTEKELQILGFSKETIFDHEGETEPDYYYVFDLVDGLTFITQASSEVKNNDWYVDIFNTEPFVRFHKMEKIQTLFNTISNAIVKDEK